jgi:hypothetical protein
LDFLNLQSEICNLKSCIRPGGETDITRSSEDRGPGSTPGRGTVKRFDGETDITRVREVRVPGSSPGRSTVAGDARRDGHRSRKADQVGSSPTAGLIDDAGAGRSGGRLQPDLKQVRLLPASLIRTCSRESSQAPTLTQRVRLLPSLLGPARLAGPTAPGRSGRGGLPVEQVRRVRVPSGALVVLGTHVPRWRVWLASRLGGFDSHRLHCDRDGRCM